MISKIMDQNFKIHLEDLEKIYVLLVWLGHRQPKDYADTEINRQVAHIMDFFPNYAEKFDLSEINQYYLGFYSGCLANIRYILAAHYEGIAIATADFPDLEVYA